MRVVITQFADPVPVPSAVSSGLTATVGGQTGARELTARVNVITAVAAGQGVKLKAIAGDQQVVANRGGADLLVYPPAGTEIENYGLNVAVVVPPGASATFTWDGVDTWWQS